ncbi:MAG: oligosaccharide repeat unit polymerase, partial [Oscillospiraceae bacterium]|nr:oligosaccharide repeat unit polymerase [Oscillospiraceae bacterium]
MFVLLYLILFAVIVLAAYGKYHRAFNIVSVFCALWTVFGILSCFGPYGMRKPGAAVHLCAMAFVLLTSVFLLAFSKPLPPGASLPAVKRELNVKRALFLQGLAVVLVLPLAVELIPVLLEEGMSDARSEFFSGTVFESMFEDLFFRTIPIAFLNAMIVFFTFCSFHEGSFVYLLLALVDAFIITLINGGRYALLQLLYISILLWISGKIDREKLRLLRRQRRGSVLVALLVVAAMVGTTFMREQQFHESLSTYFSGSFAFMDYILEHPETFALNQPLHGYLTFGAFIEPVVLALKVFGLTAAKVPSYEFNIIAQQYYNIGDGQTVLINANTSVLYYFMRDFGYFGIVVGALLLAWLISAAYNRWVRGDLFWGLVFCYLGYMLFNSLMMYQLFGPQPFFVVIAFWFCTGRGRRI